VAKNLKNNQVRLKGANILFVLNYVIENGGGNLNERYY